jgi:hypothetical protein
VNIPWKEHATLVRLAGGPNADDSTSEILFEGSLLSLVQKVTAIGPTGRLQLRVSLPDRRVRPFAFQGDALTERVGKLPRLGF